MAEQTGISWCDATFNPWIGCTRVSTGCEHCYAEDLVVRGRMNRPQAWGPKGTRERTSPGNWAKPLRWNRLAALEGRLPGGEENRDGHRPRIFCASLADVFEGRPELDSWRRDLFDLIAGTPYLDWLVLTKRPDHAAAWLRSWYEEGGGSGALFGAREWTSRDGLGWGVLPNLWIGASVESTRYAFRADELRRIPAAVRFLSCEPLLASLFTVGPSALRVTSVRAQVWSGPNDGLDLRVADADIRIAGAPAPLDLAGIDWVIVGGESGGRGARPMHPTWAREIRDAVLAQAGRPPGRPALHFKQWGSYRPDELTPDPAAAWLLVDGRVVRASDPLAIRAGDTVARMRYAGPGPKSGGKILDGTDWCEFPTAAALTPA